MELALRKTLSKTKTLFNYDISTILNRYRKIIDDAQN